MPSKTCVHITGEDFLLNGEYTYRGRFYQHMRVEGLLMNSRMIQGVFDDLNPETRSKWNYPDGPWDADRNTNEFIDAMPVWREHGLIGFTVGLQGGSPEGYSGQQPWINSAFDEAGALRPDYMDRLERILRRADELKMVPIISLFYFGQDERLKDEAAVIAAVDNVTDWLVEKEFRHVLVEIANECDHKKYEHEIIRTDRIAELIERVQERSKGKVSSPHGYLLTGTSYCGGRIPSDAVVAVSDMVIIHGNGVEEPDGIREMVRTVRAGNSYKGQPILFNEDDHFRFEEEDNNMLAAVSEHAGWGYFDFRKRGEKFEDGYQCPPVAWGIESERKSAFFRLLKKVTGA